MFKRINAGLKNVAKPVVVSDETSDKFTLLEALNSDTAEWATAVAVAREHLTNRSIDNPAILRIMQSLPQRAPTRREAVDLTYAFAASDKKFTAAVAAGDVARDSGDMAGAEYNYWQALCLYPFHGGYWIQYAHSLKEQGKFIDAAVHYRTALALKAALSDVEDHLAYALSRANRTFTKSSLSYSQQYWSSDRAGSSPLAMPPTHLDIQKLSELLVDRAGIDMMRAETVMEACKTVEDVIVAFIRDPDFVLANRNLIRLIAEVKPFGAC